MIMKMMMIVTFVVMSISTTVGQSIDNLAPVSSPNFVQLSSNNPTVVRPQSFFTDCLKATVDKSDECVTDIYYSIVHHDFKFASACCQTVFDVGAECIQERLGLVGYLLPRVLRKACVPIFKPTAASTTTTTLGLAGRDNTISSSTTTAVGKSTSNFAIDGPVEEFQKCLSSVRSVEGCVEEVVTSFLSLQYRFIGPACCKAITKINDACWPKLVPFNPFFPPLLKNYCVSLLIPNFPPPPVVTNALSIGPN